MFEIRAICTDEADPVFDLHVWPAGKMSGIKGQGRWATKDTQP